MTSTLNLLKNSIKAEGFLKKKKPFETILNDVSGEQIIVEKHLTTPHFAFSFISPILL